MRTRFGWRQKARWEWKTCGEGDTGTDPFGVGIRQINPTGELSFTNPGLHAFTVLASENVSLAVSNWTVLGAATNGGDGLFKFIDTGATNFMQRFYQLRWPHNRGSTRG